MGSRGSAAYQHFAHEPLVRRLSIATDLAQLAERDVVAGEQTPVDNQHLVVDDMAQREPVVDVGEKVVDLRRVPG